MALHLARYFGAGAGFWLRLQVDHDLEQALVFECVRVEDQASGQPRARPLPAGTRRSAEW
ncbi:MAG: hypothetical protein KKA32_08535 [Actinobacteria bacterium]|nr:hypothetical protein [Actinomycetota bacterium]